MDGMLHYWSECHTADSKCDFTQPWLMTVKTLTSMIKPTHRLSKNTINRCYTIYEQVYNQMFIDTDADRKPDDKRMTKLTH